jgi:hypothetical protein
MPAFGASVSAAAPVTAPNYAQMYGLTTGGQPEIFGKPFRFVMTSARSCTHAFKVGYEILNFSVNYWQLGQPSGVFNSIP